MKMSENLNSKTIKELIEKIDDLTSIISTSLGVRHQMRYDTK
ncbi:hypothetical protein F3D3_4086 [Fusibacter sp. 3D3]|nr:hypothetical protein F3D3_4086 [Fusibacter sp. 3D3]